MRPKHSKELIAQIADMHDIPQEHVEAMMTEYYSIVRSHLSSIADIRVHVSNLGDFVIKHWSLKDEIDKCDRIMASERAHRNTIAYMEDKKNRLQYAQALYNAELQRKEFIHTYKKVPYVEQRELNKDLAEKGTDTGGDHEQGLQEGTR